MLWVVPLGFLLLATQRGRAGPDNLIVLVFTAFAVGWLVLPLMTFGADETLDPARLALLPLRPRELVGGLLAAALTGFGPVLTVVLLAGSMIAAARGPTAVLVGLAAVAIELTICVAASRALVTALSSLLRSRRGRDLSVAISGLLVLGIYVMALTIQRAAILRPGLAGLGAGLAAVARIVRWAPPGMTANAVVPASAGRYGPAVRELGAGAVSAALALWLWLVLLRRALETADSSTLPAGCRSDRRRSARPVPAAGWRAHPRPWSSRALTTTGRELRYYRRDPRREQQLVSLAMPVFIVAADSVPGLRPGGAGGSAPSRAS
jgi:ABC-2 type transport system permease protein